METFLLLLSTGICLGIAYGLIGLGLVSVFKVCRVINLTQGEYYMLGGFLSWWFIGDLGLNFWLSLVAILALTVVVGLAVNWILVSPLLARGTPPIVIVIGTVAVAWLISGSVGAVTAYAPVRVKAILPLKVWKLAGVLPIVPQYGLVALVGIGLLLGYWIFENKTRVGLAYQAVGINRDMARLVGIPASMMTAIGFGIAAIIGALCGMIYGSMANVGALVGFPLVVKGFVAAVIGGMGNPYAAVVGGCLLGIIHMFVVGYFAPGFGEMVTFIILIFILIVRPYGLLGKPG